MKISDILAEDSAEGSNDYQKMLDLVRGNPMPGAPAPPAGEGSPD